MRWFKHMTDAHDDEFMDALRTEFGLAGYGFWWLLLEKIAKAMDKSDKNFAQYSVRFWQNLFQVSPKRFWSMLRFCEEHGKIDTVKDGKALTIFCPKLLDYRDEYSRKKRRENESSDPPGRGDTPNSEAPQPPEPAQPTHQPPPETPGLASNPLDPNDPYYVDEEFRRFIEAHPKGANMTPEAIKTWNALRAAGELPDIDTLIACLDLQKQSPDWQKDGGRFVPRPGKYLQARRWQAVLSEVRVQREGYQDHNVEGLLSALGGQDSANTTGGTP